MADASSTFSRPESYAFESTLRFQRIGRRDPTFHLTDSDAFRAWRTPTGPATLHVRDTGTILKAQAWGPGAQWAIDHADRLLGLKDDPGVFRPEHPKLARLVQVHHGLLLSDCADLVGSLLRVSVQQLWTWQEAASSWRKIHDHLGEPAPGPAPLRMLPPYDILARQPSWKLQSAGLPEKRAATFLRIAQAAHRLQEAYNLQRNQRLRIMQSLPGVGAWTAESVLGMHLGDPDALPPGDVHLPRTVRFAMTGEDARTSDDEMFEMLEPFRPNRFRVMRLIYAAKLTPPRSFPKREVRWIGE